VLFRSVIATQTIITDAMTIQKGDATGVRQVGRGIKNGMTLIELEFQATVGEAESYDEVIIKGSPDVHSRIQGGINGDIATCAIVLNAIPQIIRSTPGLKTMVDVPPVSWFD
jgi:4-hydroxy-tetrahydrodipicolinate reductase